MSKGKILAQVCHVISSIHYKLQENELKSWKNKGEAKIVLKAPFQTIKTILDKVETYNSNSDQNSNLKITRIHDAGRTQVPAGSLTVIAIGPCEKKIASQFVCDLKMY